VAKLFGGEWTIIYGASIASFLAYVILRVGDSSPYFYFPFITINFSVLFFLMGFSNSESGKIISDGKTFFALLFLAITPVILFYIVAVSVGMIGEIPHS
jgi:hypothetical protein